MASNIAAKVEKQVKGTLTNTVKEEIKKRSVGRLLSRDLGIFS